MKFVGIEHSLENQFDESTDLPFMVDGGTVFGAPSTRVQGDADLSPTLRPRHALSDLNGATDDGVQLGIDPRQQRHDHDMSTFRSRHDRRRDERDQRSRRRRDHRGDRAATTSRSSSTRAAATTSPSTKSAAERPRRTSASSNAAGAGAGVALDGRRHARADQSHAAGGL